MSNKPQNFENHAKMVPGFHYVGSILLLSLLIWAMAVALIPVFWPL